MWDVSTLIGFIVVSVLVFIICRKLVLWYFKIEVRAQMMEEQTVLLHKINSKLDRILKED